MLDNQAQLHNSFLYDDEGSSEAALVNIYYTNHLTELIICQNEATTIAKFLSKGSRWLALN